MKENTMYNQKNLKNACLTHTNDYIQYTSLDRMWKQYKSLNNDITWSIDHMW